MAVGYPVIKKLVIRQKMLPALFEQRHGTSYFWKKLITSC